MRDSFLVSSLIVPMALGVLTISAPAEARAPSGSELVTVMRTPDGGIQPQAATDAEGVIHLIYYRGDPGGGDLFYARRAADQDRFSTPIRVNSQPRSAIAAGTIRGGQLAVGKGGRAHVVWNGSEVSRPKNPFGGTPMLYARSNDKGTAFEAQRNVMKRTSVLDGGGTVAADREGNVYVGWHARTEDAPDGEKGRRMWVARSLDGGTTFKPEEPCLARETGACACCGTRALADRRGNVHALYRAATEGTERDMILLTSVDRGRHFRGRALHPWKTDNCPMSSASLAESGDAIVAGWETKGQVYFARIDPKTGKPGHPISPAEGDGTRKHPALASNAKGETILVWTQGTGWQKGGSLEWQVFDQSGRPIGEKGRVEDGVPVWGLATVVTRTDGGFAIIH
ncbi:MAG: hypothetical protein NVSMB9_35410 [Isosphaeraceae bacterium]